jgi:signal transduction histidine kinase/CheY-like chemotaxis protein
MNLKSKKILVVEDEPDVRLATKAHLESSGYTNVAVAADGEAGLASIRLEKPALVLLDRKMPGKDGLAVLSEIKDHYGDEIEVVMLTAYREKSFITEAMRQGAFHYLIKDEDPDFMLHTIESALRYHQKSIQRKLAEVEIYDLLVANEDLFRNGYRFDAFRKILTTKLGTLLDDVLHTEISDCAACAQHACYFADDGDLPPQFSEKLKRSKPGDDPPLIVLHRHAGSPFFEQAIKRYVEKERQAEVQTLVYVPFIEHPSPALLKFLQEKLFAEELIRYCCIYIFSASTLSLSPEEKRLLRGFFDRFMIAMRTAKLVDTFNLLHKYRFLGEMSAMVVHQISPLITPLIDCLQNPDAAKQTQGLAMVKELRRMVDELRDYTTGVVREYDFTDLDILRIIKQAETLFHLKTSDAIEIHHDFPPVAPTVRGDAHRLRQVFLNLFVNAAQAIAANGQAAGRINVWMTDDGTMVEVRITDNGVGVPKEIVPKLFSSYVSTKSGGTGLGLCLVSDILRRHGGRIDYNPDYVAGAEFIVKLPMPATDRKNV